MIETVAIMKLTKRWNVWLNMTTIKLQSNEEHNAQSWEDSAVEIIIDYKLK